MALIVQKYGGTSVADVERIRNVARRALAAQRAGNDVVVVVSAMAGETNRLLALTRQVCERPDEREQDVVAATGEQVTIGLLAIALDAMGHKSRSYTGGQIRVLTDSAFTKARILSIDEVRLVPAPTATIGYLAPVQSTTTFPVSAQGWRDSSFRATGTYKLYWDIEARDLAAPAWHRILTDTTAMAPLKDNTGVTTTFSGQIGHTYNFRAIPTVHQIPDCVSYCDWPEQVYLGLPSAPITGMPRGSGSSEAMKMLPSTRSGTIAGMLSMVSSGSSLRAAKEPGPTPSSIGLPVGR